MLVAGGFASDPRSPEETSVSRCSDDAGSGLLLAL